MRRLFISLSALGLFTLLVGCHHMAGVCDCDRNMTHCGCCGQIDPVPAGKVEVLKEMPRGSISNEAK